MNERKEARKGGLHNTPRRYTFFLNIILFFFTMRRLKGLESNLFFKYSHGAGAESEKLLCKNTFYILPYMYTCDIIHFEHKKTCYKDNMILFLGRKI